jgi:hypothetical protein
MGVINANVNKKKKKISILNSNQTIHVCFQLITYKHRNQKAQVLIIKKSKIFLVISCIGMKLKGKGINVIR